MTGPGHAAQHEPFDPGNTVAERHGAHSELRFRPLADQLVAAKLAECPWLGRPAFREAVDAWAIAEAKARLVDAWLDEAGQLDGKHHPRPAAVYADRLHARADRLRQRLGLDVVAFGGLLATFATLPGGEDALEALRSEGRRLVEASAAALPGPAERGRGAETPVQADRSDAR